MENKSEESINRIWNPAAAVNWSLLLTPAFGPVLHYLNWKSLNEQKREKSSLIWAVVFCFLVALSLLDFTGEAGKAAFLFAFILLFVWYFVTARKQIRYVSEKLGKTYPKKEWFEPIMIAAAIIGVSSLIPI